MEVKSHKEKYRSRGCSQAGVQSFNCSFSAAGEKVEPAT